MAANLRSMALGLAFMLFSMSAVAQGQQIWVEGQTERVDQHGAGVSTTTSTLKVTYQNEDLGWGAKVFLVMGYRSMNEGSWASYVFPNEMASVSASTWQIQVKLYGDKYTGPLLNFEYVFRIQLPDGRSYYDNGGKAPMGFYSTPIPHTTRPWEALPIWILGSADDYQ